MRNFVKSTFYLRVHFELKNFFNVTYCQILTYMKSIKLFSKNSLIICYFIIYRLDDNCEQCWMFEPIVFIFNFSLNKRKEFFVMILSFSYLRIRSFPCFIILNSLLHMNHSRFGHLSWIKETRMFSVHTSGKDASTSSSRSFSVESNHFFLTSLNNVQIGWIHLVNVTLTVVEGSVNS